MSVFDREEFKRYRNRWNKRRTILMRRKAYATGDIYKSGLLSADIEPLYLPLSKAVSVDCGIIPRGWTFVDGTPDNIIEARDKIFTWSSWRTDGVLYTQYGAQMGVVGLKVSDMPEEKIIKISAVDPTKFMIDGSDEYDSTPSIAFYVEKRDGDDGKYEYAEVITPKEISTFKDGVLHGFGGRKAIYKNSQGLVPYVEVLNMKTGDPLGKPTFEDAIAMLDKVNQIATQLSDIIRQNQAPQWVAFGAEATDLFKSEDNVWFFPGGSDIKPVVANIDITGVLEYIREIAKNVKDALPERALEDVRDKKLVASETLGIMLFDLIVKVLRMRPNYDVGLEKALRIAGMAAEKMGLPEIAALNTPDLKIDVNREILPIDQRTRMELEMLGIELEQMRGMANYDGQQ